LRLAQIEVTMNITMDTNLWRDFMMTLTTLT
jgi:hypothetical protein